MHLFTLCVYVLSFYIMYTFPPGAERSSSPRVISSSTNFQIKHSHQVSSPIIFYRGMRSVNYLFGQERGKVYVRQNEHYKVETFQLTTNIFKSLLRVAIF